MQTTTYNNRLLLTIYIIIAHIIWGSKFARWLPSQEPTCNWVQIFIADSSTYKAQPLKIIGDVSIYAHVNTIRRLVLSLYINPTYLFSPCFTIFAASCTSTIGMQWLHIDLYNNFGVLSTWCGSIKLMFRKHKAHQLKSKPASAFMAYSSFVTICSLLHNRHLTREIWVFKSLFWKDGREKLTWTSHREHRRYHCVVSLTATQATAQQ